MRFRPFAIPMAEFVLILALIAIGLACLLVRDAYTQYVNGPTSFGAPDMHIVGNTMLDDEGRHTHDWIPPNGDEPGHWKINDKYASELHLPRKPVGPKP